MKEIFKKTGDIQVVDEAENGNQVLSKVSKNDYDVILLDISMPGRGGLDTLKQLKQENPHVHILILSMFSEEEFAVRAMKTGASGYFVKDFGSKNLIEAIRRVSMGLKYITPSLAEKLARYVESDDDKSLHLKLSNWEYEILRKIAAGMKNIEIAEELFLSEKTVSTYKRRILDKMNMKTNAQLIEYAIRNGLIK